MLMKLVVASLAVAFVAGAVLNSGYGSHSSSELKLKAGPQSKLCYSLNIRNC